MTELLFIAHRGDCNIKALSFKQVLFLIVFAHKIMRKSQKETNIKEILKKLIIML